MTLEGANLFFDTADYSVYAMNSQVSGQYCAVLPKNNTGVCNMLVDLHMKNAFDGLTNGSKTKDQVIEEIKNEYNGIKSKYQDGILVLPMIDENLYTSAVVNNDEQKMADKVKKIGGITKEIYNKLINSGIAKEKIDQKIIMIIKNNDDIKFVDWLKAKMPDFVIGINLSDLQAVATVNPFANNNPFEESATTPVTSANNDVFQVTSNPQVDNNLFATPPETTPVSTQNVETTQQPTVEQNSSAPAGVQPVQQPIQPAQNVVATPNLEPVAPTPVQATPLEATTTMPTIQQNVENQVAQQPTQTENIPAKKGSKGFTNLIILLVVLVGVTFISIELGKFLYNTYGV